MRGDDCIVAPLPAAAHPRHRWGRALGRETLDALTEALSGHRVDADYEAEYQRLDAEWDATVTRVHADAPSDGLLTQNAVIGMVNELTDPRAPLRGDLDAAIRDLAQAARGLREWSELLDEKPNAVIFGRDRP